MVFSKSFVNGLILSLLIVMMSYTSSFAGDKWLNISGDVTINLSQFTIIKTVVAPTYGYIYFDDLKVEVVNNKDRYEEIMSLPKNKKEKEESKVRKEVMKA